MQERLLAFDAYLIDRIKHARAFGEADENKILTEVYREFKKLMGPTLDTIMFQAAPSNPKTGQLGQ